MSRSKRSFEVVAARHVREPEDAAAGLLLDRVDVPAVEAHFREEHVHARGPDARDRVGELLRRGLEAVPGLNDRLRRSVRGPRKGTRSRRGPSRCGRRRGRARRGAGAPPREDAAASSCRPSRSPRRARRPRGRGGRALSRASGSAATPRERRGRSGCSLRPRRPGRSGTPRFGSRRARPSFPAAFSIGSRKASWPSPFTTTASSDASAARSSGRGWYECGSAPAGTTGTTVTALPPTFATHE